jgi:hypothetical protein
MLVDHRPTLAAARRPAPRDYTFLSWQIVPTALLELTADPDRGRADRAFAAMLQMKKIDIAELYRAADRA